MLTSDVSIRQSDRGKNSVMNSFDDSTMSARLGTVLFRGARPYAFVQ